MDFEKLIYVVVGAIIGFTLSLIKDLLMESKKQEEKNNQLKRKRLEELHILVSHWSNIIFTHSTNLVAVMQGKLMYNEHLDLITEYKSDGDFQRLEMILSIYASELSDTYNKVLDIRTKLNAISIKYEHQYENGDTNGNKFINQYIKYQIDFEKYTDKLKNEITKLALK